MPRVWISSRYQSDSEPTAGEIVWSHFRDDITPRPKPWPALVLVVFDDDAPQFTVRGAYGTSQRTTTLHLPSSPLAGLLIAKDTEQLRMIIEPLKLNFN